VERTLDQLGSLLLTLPSKCLIDEISAGREPKRSLNPSYAPLRPIPNCTLLNAGQRLHQPAMHLPLHCLISKIRGELKQDARDQVGFDDAVVRLREERGERSLVRRVGEDNLGGVRARGERREVGRELDLG